MNPPQESSSFTYGSTTKNNKNSNNINNNNNTERLYADPPGHSGRMWRCLLNCSYLVLLVSIALPSLGWYLEQRSLKCIPELPVLLVEPPSSPNPSLHQRLELPDSRLLGFATFGSNATAELTVFYFHGFPGSRAEAAGLWTELRAAAQTLAARVFLVAIERPGSGLSTFQHGRSISDWADDVLAVADHLHVPKFAVMGVSGGGPYALACAHNIPPARLVATAVVGGMAPVDSAPTTGMLPASRVIFHPWAAPLVPLAMGSMAYMMRSLAAQERPDPTPFKDGMPDVDCAMLDCPHVIESVLGSRAGAFDCGIAGATHEIRLIRTYASWGFRLDRMGEEAIAAAPAAETDSVTVDVFQGDLDVNTPVGMATWQCEQIDRSPHASCNLHRFPAEGHVSLIVGSAVMQALLETSRTRSS